MSRVYLITEEQKSAMLKELELEKFKTPDQFCITDEARQAQLKAVDDMHHRFHCIVCRLLS